MSRTTEVKVTATLYGVVRMTNSRDGNPRYRLVTNEGEFFTKPDSWVNYDIPNLTRGMESLLDREVELTMTGAGLVWDIARA